MERVDGIFVLGKIQDLLNFIMPVLIAIAVVWFIWGVIQYTISDDDEKKKKARGNIISGLIGLFVILAFWSLVSLIGNTLGLEPIRLKSKYIPCVPSPNVRCP